MARIKTHCGGLPVLLALAVVAACSKPVAVGGPAAPMAVAAAPTTLDPAAFRRQLEATPGLVLDVRTAEEVSRGHLADATHLDIRDPRFGNRAALLDKTKPVFVYCAAGSRSAKAAAWLTEHGFTQVYNLDGGIRAWEAGGLPVDRSARPFAASGAETTPAQFATLVRSKPLVLVEFQTPWCVPCQRMAPVVQDIARTWQGRAEVVVVDVDASEALAQQEQVIGVPVLAVYRDGREVWRHAGEVAKAEIEAALAGR